MDLSNINFLAVAVAGIASFALGALWYSPVLFSKIWQREVGLSEESMKNTNVGRIFGSSFVLMLIMSLGMAMIFRDHTEETFTWLSGLKHGLFFGVVFAATSMGINYLYQRKSLTLWAIDSGYQVLFLGIAGAILGAWH